MVSHTVNSQNGVPSAAGLRGWAERLSPAPAGQKTQNTSVFSKWLKEKASTNGLASTPQLWVDRYCDRQLGFIDGTIELPERKTNKDGTYKVCSRGPWWYPDQSNKPVIVRFGTNNVLVKIAGKSVFLDDLEDFREFVQFFRENWMHDPEVNDNILRLHKAYVTKSYKR